MSKVPPPLRHNWPIAEPALTPAREFSMAWDIMRRVLTGLTPPEITQTIVDALGGMDAGQAGDARNALGAGSVGGAVFVSETREDALSAAGIGQFHFLANNASAGIPLDGETYLFAFHANNPSNVRGFAVVRLFGAMGAEIIVATGGTVNTYTDTPLTGTTGAAGALNISSTDGVLWVENRMGSNMALRLMIFGILQ